MPGVPSRVLLAHTAFLGDLVLCQPLIEAVARAVAPDPLDVLVRPSCRDLAATFAGVAEALPAEKDGLFAPFRQASRLARRGYRLAVTPHKSFRTGLTLALARIPERVGFEGAPGALFYTKRAVDPKQGPYPERMKQLLPAIGAGPGRENPLLAPTDSARASVEAKLAAAGVAPRAAVVGINPGSVWGTKRWLPEGYGELASELVRRGMTPVLVGAPEDRDVAAQVARLGGAGVLDLSGKTTLPELVALCARCAVFVTGDSGPMHIAAAVGTPVVAIFGPTTPALGFAPRIAAAEIVERALECRPCHRHGPPVCPLGHFRCMREIGAADVLAATERLLALPSRKAEAQ